ncbi:MAG: YigZ family protein, partial [Clostridia bacterium]|nr:YigZ family protein [Clostridia bacterium]
MEEVYVTLGKEGVSEFEMKKSVFIGHAAPVKTEEEALEYIAKYKKKYSDATHNVWAYLIKNGNLMRYTDDGEPSGTSGIPVLDIIRKGGFT